MKQTIFIIMTFFIFQSLVIKAQDSQRNFIYLPVDGKIVGIWPESGYGIGIEGMKELRKKWGFTGLFIFNDWVSDTAQMQYEWATYYDDEINAPLFADEYIMQPITSKHQSKDLVNKFDVGYYYVDEPLEAAGYNLEELSERSKYIDSARPNSIFMISSNRLARNSDFEKFMDEHPNIHIMYSSYVDFVNVLGFWIPWGDDQRPSWTDMRNRFGEQFSHSWVDGRGDEYEQLFRHADYLGLKGVWLYCGNGTNPTNLANFCEAASLTGWLKKIYAPKKINLLIPENNSEDIDIRSSFRWQNDSAAIEYIFQVAEDHEFTSVIIDTLVDEDSLSLPFSLTNGMEYYWRVMGINQAGNGEWSDSFSFKIAKPNLVKPQLISPVNNSDELHLPITFNWTHPCEEVNFFFEVSEDMNFGSIVLKDTLGSPQIKIDSLEDGKKYFWRIVTEGEEFNPAVSDTFNFSTTLLPPINLIVEKMDDDHIQLSWETFSKNTNIYSIERKHSNEDHYFPIAAVEDHYFKFIDSTYERSKMIRYRIKALNELTESIYSSEESILLQLTDFEDNIIPAEFRLYQNFPNPFNPVTMIKFSIPLYSDNVLLRVFDILGNEIVTLIDGPKPAGFYEVYFNGENLSSGIYIVQMKTNDFYSSIKLLLLK